MAGSGPDVKIARQQNRRLSWLLQANKQTAHQRLLSFLAQDLVSHIRTFVYFSNLFLSGRRQRTLQSLKKREKCAFSHLLL